MDSGFEDKAIDWDGIEMQESKTNMVKTTQLYVKLDNDSTFAAVKASSLILHKYPRAVTLASTL